MTSGNWLNADGLYQKYGTSKADVETAGEYKTFGSNRVIECVLDLTTLGTSPAIISDNLRFPITQQIELVEVFTETAATGTGAVLNVGLIKADRSTQLDYDGLVAGLPLTSVDTIGEKTTLNVGSTYAGALIGTATTDVGAYLCADYDTAAFTAGKVRIRVQLHGYGTITN